MNRRRSIIAAVLVLTLALIVFRLMREIKTPGVPLSIIATPTPIVNATPTPASTTPEPDYAKLKPKKELMRETLNLLNHKDIEFYGKVVDQNRVPVAGAMPFVCRVGTLRTC